MAKYFRCGFERSVKKMLAKSKRKKRELCYLQAQKGQIQVDKKAVAAIAANETQNIEIDDAKIASSMYGDCKCILLNKS